MKEQHPLMKDVATSHVDDFLNVPGAEIILMSKDEQTWSVSRLAALLNRLAVQDENRRLNFWIKIEG